MTLTDEQLIEIRVQIGDSTPPTDNDLDAIYVRKGDQQLVVAEVLTRRLANLLSDPASFSVSGEYSQSTSDNIKALREQLGNLPQVDGGGFGSIVQVFPQPSPRHR